MTSLLFPPTFEHDFADSSSESQQPSSTHSAASKENPQNKVGGFAAFICHVAYLEDRLNRGSKSKFFDGGSNGGMKTLAKKQIGHGTSFIVDRAELAYVTGDGSTPEFPRTTRYVAIKTVKEQPRYKT
jgi:hypothetical protein